MNAKYFILAIAGSLSVTVLFAQQCSACIRLADKGKKTNFARPVAIDLVWSLAIRFRYTT